MFSLLRSWVAHKGSHQRPLQEAFLQGDLDSEPVYCEPVKDLAEKLKLELKLLQRDYQDSVPPVPTLEELKRVLTKQLMKAEHDAANEIERRRRIG